MSQQVTKSMDDIVALCRRRGFIWQSSEIYGGINGFWDYGPLGAALKRNLKNAWWQDVIECPPDGPDGQTLDIVPVDTTIIMHPKVWEASGHVGGFNDPMVDDKETKQRFRADHLVGLYLMPVDLDPADFIMMNDDQMRDSFELVATAVASHVGEATSLIISNPKGIVFDPDAKLRVKGVEPEDAEDFVQLRFRVLKITFNAAMRLGVFLPVPIETVNEHHDAIPSPFTGKKGSLTRPRQFNLMFQTHTGAVQSDESLTYLRPETAQGIFTQFWNVVDTSRVKVPFGIAQIGKSFRNEVTPRNFTFRSREFEQMEIEFFIRPETAHEWYRYWRDSRYKWWQSIGLAGDNLTLREHDKDELSHYAKEGAGVCDVEYRFPFTAPGYGELEGVAHRSNFDLRAHAEACGKGDKLKYFDQERNEKYFPHVIEPSAGADRGTLAVLCEAYTPDESRASKVYMKFTPRMAPIKAGIFPLVAKDGMPERAEKIYDSLRRRYALQLDVKQNIGKRYARMDEAGTPYCFTIDGQTLEDNTVTVRHRDTQHQERISEDKIGPFLAEKIGE